MRKTGDVILCPIHSLARIPKEVIGEGILFGLVRKNGQYYIRYRLGKGDEIFPDEAHYMKMQFFATGLSITTLDHFWTDDVLLDEEFKVIWHRPKAIALVTDKEIDSTGPLNLRVPEFLKAAEITGWIAMRYARVFTYHRIGLFLLRSALPTEYFYADVLLNFWKIIELVVQDRTHRKPTLRRILGECSKLEVPAANADEIREFFVVRSRDSAHDFGQVEEVSRQKAVECKLLAEALILLDFVDRTKDIPSTYAVEVHETFERAVVREKTGDRHAK